MKQALSLSDRPGFNQAGRCSQTGPRKGSVLLDNEILYWVTDEEALPADAMTQSINPLNRGHLSPAEAELLASHLAAIGSILSRSADAGVPCPENRWNDYPAETAKYAWSTKLYY